MIVKLLTEHHLEFLSLKGCRRGSCETHLSKCQIVGNLMQRLKYKIYILPAALPNAAIFSSLSVSHVPVNNFSSFSYWLVILSGYSSSKRSIHNECFPKTDRLKYGRCITRYSVSKYTNIW